MSEKRITLYTAEESPFPHRVTLALEEANLPYDVISFELINKPDWFAEKVYPTVAKVPYLVYGGPKLQPGDSPSPDLPQLGESLVILEFLADTFPEARLLPSDPFLRAKARLFCRAIEEKFMPAFVGFFFKQAPKEPLYDALEHIQGLLPSTGFAVGEWSIADAAFLPLYLRALTMLELNPAMLALESAAEVSATLGGSPRFARIRKYLEENMARPSMAKTWDPVRLISRVVVRVVEQRDAERAALQVSVKAKATRRFEFLTAQAQKTQQN
ncbi:hypothetical protein LXA43DRAFT_900544 [Ganoderma leucocontextum]|nr:hypothetical protein LXA43DRAFT_900544 [Ganoderma leucocontextum]